MSPLEDVGTIASRKNLFLIARRAARRSGDDWLEARRRDENQLIEMLAYLFQEVPTALALWLRTLNQPSLEGLAGWQVDTQHVLLSRRRPDLVLLAPGQARVLVECKIDSDEGENQLIDYAKHLRHECAEPSRVLVYLTAVDDGRDRGLAGQGVDFVHQRWRGLAEALGESDETLARDFIALLEEDKLVTPNALTSVEFEAWSEGYQLSDRMLELVDDAVKKVSAFPELGFEKLGNLNMARGSVYRIAYGKPLSVALSIAPAKGRTGGPRVGVGVLHVEGTARTSAELKELAHHVKGWEYGLSWGEWPTLKRPLLEVIESAGTYDEQVQALVSLCRQALEHLTAVGYLPAG